MMRPRRVFVDTEFVNRGADHPLSLISIGMVDNEDNEFYGINVDAPLSAMWRDEFIRDMVWEHLPLPPVTSYGFGGIGGTILEWDEANSQVAHLMLPADLRDGVLEFLTRGGSRVELWGDYCAFDMVLLSQLFGPFKDVPPKIPTFMNDLQQLRRILGEPSWLRMLEEESEKATAPVIEHHALVDAWTVKHRYDWFMNPKDEMPVDLVIVGNET